MAFHEINGSLREGGNSVIYSEGRNLEHGYILGFSLVEEVTLDEVIWVAEQWSWVAGNAAGGKIIREHRAERARR